VPSDGQVDDDDRMGRCESCLDIAVTGLQHECFRRPAGRETARSRAGIQYRRQHIGFD
jgi:hypothetical protein